MNRILEKMDVDYIQLTQTVTHICEALGYMRMVSSWEAGQLQSS